MKYIRQTVSAVRLMNPKCPTTNADESAINLFRNQRQWQVEARSLVVLYVALKVAWNIFLKYVKQYS